MCGCRRCSKRLGQGWTASSPTPDTLQYCPGSYNSCSPINAKVEASKHQTYCKSGSQFLGEMWREATFVKVTLPSDGLSKWGYEGFQMGWVGPLVGPSHQIGFPRSLLWGTYTGQIWVVGPQWQGCQKRKIWWLISAIVGPTNGGGCPKKEGICHVTC